MPAIARVDACVQGLKRLHAAGIERLFRECPIRFEQPFDFGQSAAHDIAHNQIDGVGEALRQLRDDEIGLPDDVAAIGLEFAGDEFERRRFAGAVAADQADAFAGLDGELGVGEDGLFAELETDLGESDQGHGRDRMHARACNQLVLLFKAIDLPLLRKNPVTS